MTLKPSEPMKKGSVQKCREASSSLNQSVITMLTTVGTRNTPGFQGAIQSKVNQVKSSLEALRASINALPNIDTDIETQAERITSLQEQLRLKNEFIAKIREQKLEELFPPPILPPRRDSSDEKEDDDDEVENEEEERVIKNEDDEEMDKSEDLDKSEDVEMEDETSDRDNNAIGSGTVKKAESDNGDETD